MNKKVRIFDGTLIVRRRLETTRNQSTLRLLASECLYQVSEIWIWVFDLPGGNDARRAIYPDYKMKRKPVGADIFPLINLWRELVPHTAAYTCAVQGYEADDVIWNLCKQSSNYDIIVETTDGDLRALEVLPNVRVASESLKTIRPDLITTYKATVGDPSDNIKGIPGFGKKAWDACHHQHLTRWLEGETEEIPLMTTRLMEYCTEHVEYIRTIYRMLKFREIPPDILFKNLVAGVPNFPAIDSKLKELCQ